MELGNYGQRVPPSGIRELNVLSESINQLAVQLESQRSELHDRAFFDPLTRLPNRALFLDRLDHALSRTSRRGARLAVLFLDLDNFKVINDSLGHQAGDELLAAVAQRLRHSTRAEDTVARLGGDEFTILVEDLDGADEAIAMTERIGARMQAPFSFGGHEVVVSCSIGIALSTPDHTTAGEMLREADLAMYRAESSGKAGYAMFDRSMSVKATERLELEVELRRALEHDELRVYYQPIVTLESGRVLEVEALVRWLHPTHGVIPPARFIPIAEETGLIVPLGAWVLREACRQVSVWQRELAADPPMLLSVNLSARQFVDSALVQQVSEALSEAELPASCLKLELTESMLLGNGPSIIARLEELRALGVRLAIDDFGTGYSSLAYLKRFPVDIIKIDRSFIDGLGRDPENAAIVRNIVSLAQTLGLAVTGEGIETDDQRAQLQALGCEQGQGYYFARPLPGAELGEILGRTQYLPADAPEAGSGQPRPTSATTGSAPA
jgi:diguanylate cyclase (GGDEF)-like protein